MKIRYILGSLGLAATFALTGCGGTGGNATAAQGAATLEVQADPSGALAFQQTTLEATAGQPVSVNFGNPAPLPHNWVLVQPGQEQAVVDATTAKNGEAAGVAGVIAGSKVLNADGKETVAVPAQAAGTYPYICTVPGHYAAGMKGTLTVK